MTPHSYKVVSPSYTPTAVVVQTMRRRFIQHFFCHMVITGVATFFIGWWILGVGLAATALNAIMYNLQAAYRPEIHQDRERLQRATSIIARHAVADLSKPGFLLLFLLSFPSSYLYASARTLWKIISGRHPGFDKVLLKMGLTETGLQEIKAVVDKPATISGNLA